MLHAFGHPVATCCDMLGIENRTSPHARAQHCCTNLAKRLQRHATSTNVAWKIWPVSNLSQQHPTCRNTSQHIATGWPNARNMFFQTMLRYVALKCCDRLVGALLQIFKCRIFPFTWMLCWTILIFVKLVTCNQSVRSSLRHTSWKPINRHV